MDIFHIFAGELQIFKILYLFLKFFDFRFFFQWYFINFSKNKLYEFVTIFLFLILFLLKLPCCLRNLFSSFCRSTSMLLQVFSSSVSLIKQSAVMLRFYFFADFRWTNSGRLDIGKLTLFLLVNEVICSAVLFWQSPFKSRFDYFFPSSKFVCFSAFIFSNSSNWARF